MVALVNAVLREIINFTSFALGSYGTLDLNLIYDDVNQLLVVNVLKARVSESPRHEWRNETVKITKCDFQKIRGIDINGLCDSYCKVTIVPQMGKVSLNMVNQLHESQINNRAQTNFLNLFTATVSDFARAIGMLSP